MLLLPWGLFIPYCIALHYPVWTNLHSFLCVEAQGLLHQVTNAYIHCFPIRDVIKILNTLTADCQYTEFTVFKNSLLNGCLFSYIWTFSSSGFTVYFLFWLFFTDRISVGGNAIASVHLSIRPCVSTLSLEPTDRWPSTFVCKFVMTIAQGDWRSKS